MEAQALDIVQPTTVSSLGVPASQLPRSPTSPGPRGDLSLDSPGFSPPLHAYSSAAATAGLNLELNRYMDILPYDRTRVHLSGEAARSTSLSSPVLQGRISDYINASWVSFPGRWWIATQAPLPHSLDRFWYMVADQDITILVNLTPSVEKGYVKAHPYWPTEETPVLEYEGGLEVHHVSSAPFPRAPEDMTIRHLKLIRPIHPTTPTIPPSSPIRERAITLIHYHTWPDHGVPKKPATPLLHLLDELEILSPAEDPDKAPEEILTPPILVHCSAGCGRTGTLCVLDAILRLIRHTQGSSSTEKDDPASKAGKITSTGANPSESTLTPSEEVMQSEDPVVSLVERARAARPQMVQSLTQLLFIYDVIKYYFTRPQGAFFSE
ncbi:MAG: protein-tyrosine phosphatase-like protein [Piptocephalis tieghemiana]|nr:MAG: protein-tyrosine phosphatase-like protein [Piptocephalis tieghemiana]